MFSNIKCILCGSAENTLDRTFEEQGRFKENENKKRTLEISRRPNGESRLGEWHLYSQDSESKRGRLKN